MSPHMFSISPSSPFPPAPFPPVDPDPFPPLPPVVTDPDPDPFPPFPPFPEGFFASAIHTRATATTMKNFMVNV